MMRSTARPHSRSRLLLREGRLLPRVSRGVQVIEEGQSLGDVNPRQRHQGIVGRKRGGDSSFQLSGRSPCEGMLAQDGDAGSRKGFGGPHRCRWNFIAHGVRSVNGGTDTVPLLAVDRSFCYSQRTAGLHAADPPRSAGLPRAWRRSAPRRRAPRPLDARYFERFGTVEIARHVGAVSALGRGVPAAVLVDPGQRGVRVTVVAYDHPGAFSAIAGVLSSMGFDIVGGDIFTWTRPSAGVPPRSWSCDGGASSIPSPGAVAASRWDEAGRPGSRRGSAEVFALFERGGDSVREGAPAGQRDGRRPRWGSSPGPARGPRCTRCAST